MDASPKIESSVFHESATARTRAALDAKRSSFKAAGGVAGQTYSKDGNEIPDKRVIEIGGKQLNAECNAFTAVPPKEASIAMLRSSVVQSSATVQWRESRRQMLNAPKVIMQMSRAFEENFV